MNRGGLVALVAAAAGWGSLSATTTIALQGFGPITLLVGELAVAVLVLGVACVATSQRLPRPSLPLIALGLLEPGVAYLAFNFGVQRTSSSHAGLLLGLETGFVVVLGTLVLRERPHPLSLVGILLAVAGVGVLTWHPGGDATVLGDALVLVDAIAAAVAVILTARLVRDVSALALTTMQFAIGLVLITPVWAAALLTGTEPPLPGQLPIAPVVALLLTGGVGTAGAFLIYAWALTRVSVTSAGAAATLTPLFALALSVLVLGEQLTTSALISAGLILAGLTIYAATRQRPATRRPAPPWRSRASAESPDVRLRRGWTESGAPGERSGRWSVSSGTGSPATSHTEGSLPELLDPGVERDEQALPHPSVST